MSAHNVELRAMRLASGLLTGTLPVHGVIACPDEASAAHLLARVKHWMRVLSEDDNDAAPSGLPGTDAVMY